MPTRPRACERARPGSSASLPSPSRPTSSASASARRWRTGPMRTRNHQESTRTTMATSSSTTAAPLRVRFDRFEIDEAEARLSDSGHPVHLAPKPFALLCALARTPHALITKSALLDDVWGHQFVSESVLKTSISDLRAALQDDPKQPRYIETVSRRGYRFIGAVSEAAKPAVPSGVLAAPAPASEAESVSAPASIGRADVLARLRTAWGTANTGRRQIVWVSG